MLFCQTKDFNHLPMLSIIFTYCKIRSAVSLPLEWIEIAGNNEGFHWKKSDYKYFVFQKFRDQHFWEQKHMGIKNWQRWSVRHHAGGCLMCYYSNREARCVRNILERQVLTQLPTSVLRLLSFLTFSYPHHYHFILWFTWISINRRFMSLLFCSYSV